MNIAAYWIIALSLSPLLLGGAIAKMRSSPASEWRIVLGCVFIGTALILGYVGYATLGHGLNPIDVLLGNFNPNNVTNFWGIKQVPYLVPIGVVFITVGFLTACIHAINFRK